MRHPKRRKRKSEICSSKTTKSIQGFDKLKWINWWLQCYSDFFWDIQLKIKIAHLTFTHLKLVHRNFFAQLTTNWLILLFLCCRIEDRRGRRTRRDIHHKPHWNNRNSLQRSQVRKANEARAHLLVVYEGKKAEVQGSILSRRSHSSVADSQTFSAQSSHGLLKLFKIKTF